MSRREEILDAAERLLERDGRGALTMRALAEDLGIRAPSLYKHLAGKDELEAGLQARALRSMGEALAGADPGVAGLAAAYRAWAHAHPRLYELATRVPLRRDLLPEGLEAAAARPVVEAAGGDADRARALWATAHGLVDLELAGRFPADADLDAAWGAAFAAYA